jgi:SAM-dependent methyltransferase
LQQETSTLEESGEKSKEITSESQAYQPQRQSYSSHQSGLSKKALVELPQYAGPVPDDAASGEADSALGSNGSTHSTSLKEQAFKFRHFNGRRYHAEQYNGTEYYLPNDELELDRLDLQHHLFLLTLKGSLHCAPLPQDIESVLDIGTGTGIWAIDFADLYPSCVVIGTDLSPIQPSYIPPNCRFYVEDAENPWVFERTFNYIHGRMLVVGVKNWPEFFRQAYANLEPGGYIELQDLNFPLRCDDNTAPPDSPTMRWSSYMMEGAHNLGVDLDASNSFPTLLMAAGFRDIRSETHAWPINRWPKAQEMKERGMWVLQNFLQGLQGFSMAFFTRGLGWKPAEVEVLLSGVRKQMKDRRSHVYMPISFFWARKPK